MKTARVKFPPQDPEQLGHIAEQYLGSFDHGMAGRTKGHEQLERRRSRLTMVNGQHGIDRASLAAAATMLIPGEDLFAEPGEVLPVGPLPVVATLAETADIYRGRTAAAEEHPLPQTGENLGTFTSFSGIRESETR